MGGHFWAASSIPELTILSAHDNVTLQSKFQLTRLRTEFKDLVLQPIHRATVLRECSAQGKTVFEVDAGSRAAKEYAALVWRVLDA